MPAFKKDPDDRLDYGVDWTLWLGSDTIASSEWFVTAPPADATPLAIETNPPASNDEKTTKVWVRGGTAGVGYGLTNRIETAGGRQKDRSLQVVVVQQ